MHAYHAQKQFEDNRQHFADTSEKQNLYAGLTNLAAELQRISSRLQNIEAALQKLSR